MALTVDRGDEVSTGIEQAVLLVGGRGTRLGALTESVPKPMLPVAGRPFLDWLASNLARHGVRRLVLASGYRAEAFDGWSPAGMEVRTFVEEEALGTGGALPLLRDWLDERFFVLNGDTLLDAPIAELGARLATSEALGAVALRSVADTSRYGRVRMDGGRIVDFAEKSAPGPGWINGGIYAFRREVLERIATPSNLESDLLPSLASEGLLLGLPSEGFFLDIGLPETYEEAQSAVPRWWAGTGVTEG